MGTLGPLTGKSATWAAQLRIYNINQMKYLGIEETGQGFMCKPFEIMHLYWQAKCVYISRMYGRNMLFTYYACYKPLTHNCQLSCSAGLNSEPAPFCAYPAVSKKQQNAQMLVPAPDCLSAQKGVMRRYCWLPQTALRRGNVSAVVTMDWRVSSLKILLTSLSWQSGLQRQDLRQVWHFDTKPTSARCRLGGVKLAIELKIPVSHHIDSWQWLRNDFWS